MGRNRANKNNDLPPYLYRYWHSDGKVRYRLKLTSGQYFSFPKGIKKNHAINEAVSYNIRHRSMTMLIEEAHAPRAQEESQFNIPLAKAIGEIYPLIEREELSHGSLKKYQSITQKLCHDLGNVLTHDLNLAMLNNFLESHYGQSSAHNYNNNLSYINKAFGYLADQSFIPDNFMRNKKRRKVTKLESVKQRQRLTLEEFELIYDQAPLFLKIAMALTLETTHSVHEVCRIKYKIREPKDNHCGIVWNKDKKPVVVDGQQVYGYLYIHRQKVLKSSASRVKIPVTQSIYDIVQLSYTDRLSCPYIVHKKPVQKQRGIAKDCDHVYQVQSHYLSKQFSRIRDKVGVKADLPSNQRPTYHEIRSLAARLIEQQGRSATSRMAHNSSRTTEIYTKSHEAMWNECEPLSLRRYSSNGSISN